VHVPDLHAPFEHGVPSGFAGLEHDPEAESHVPASWHSSDAGQSFAVPLVHMPAWHASPLVHALPSSHDVPSAFATSEHLPVVLSHVPAVWHWSFAVQVTGFEPTHCPVWHSSICVQASPSSHVVPSLAFDQAVVEVIGAHTWHAFIGFEAPAGTTAPPMKHSAPHIPLLHTSPAAHAVPSGSDGCLHTPIPSHWSPVHALPSSGHITPAPLFVTLQPPLLSQVEAA
jgi:hypothetical protein